MENQELNLFSLSIDHTSKANIKNTATWVTVLVICGVIGIVLSLYEFIKPAPKVILNESGYNPPLQGENIISLLLGLIINIVLIIFLYNFSRLAKRGVENSNIADISKGFLNLKNYFLVIGVLFIIIIFFLLIVLTFIGSV